MRQKFLCEWLDVGGRCFASLLCKPKRININMTLTRYKGDLHGESTYRYPQGQQSRPQYYQGEVCTANQKRSHRSADRRISGQSSGTAAETGIYPEDAKTDAGSSDRGRNSKEPPQADHRSAQAYRLSIEAALQKKLHKLLRRNPGAYRAVLKKSLEIRQNPQHYKNLRGRMKALKCVHIDRSFVLLFSVDENLKTVPLEDLEHHNQVYQ